MWSSVRTDFWRVHSQENMDDRKLYGEFRERERERDVLFTWTSLAKLPRSGAGRAGRLETSRQSPLPRYHFNQFKKPEAVNRN